MARKKQRKLSKKEVRAEKNESFRIQQTADRNLDNNNNNNTHSADSGKPTADRQVIEIAPILTVREFADVLKVPVTQVISKLVKNGVMATINESIDFDTMAIIADELGFEAKQQQKEKAEKKIGVIKKNLKSRAPIVTIMGHVDHGKTKLLDAIRNTDIIATESGGITQHIGAYQVEFRQGEETKSRGGGTDRGIPRQARDDFAPTRKITFLDTPGHEAFSAMRAHGANITDVVVLVVAANDGVKPQTTEAYNHAKEAKVPIVVAINKIDLPDADIEKTKRQIADMGLLAEEWGGKAPIIEVSAKINKNIDKLLEMILLVADLEELKADSEMLADGVVIESHMQAGRGPIATVLIQEGTLKIGDPVVIGQTYGKVRIMENYLGRKIVAAGPSTPVRIAGLQDLPNFGDRFLVVENEKIAKELVKTKTIKRRVLSIGEISRDIKEGKVKELKIILKADVAGSLEAIKNSLENISTSEVKINIIHEGVGDILESDINMAIASVAIVIGFRVKAPVEVMTLAQRENVKISIYEIIYQLLEDLEAALSGLLEPEIVETELGRLKVLAIFKVSKNDKIIGGKVTTGKIMNETEARIVRDRETIGQGKITSLQQNKKDINEVLEGFECGLKIETTTKIQVDDSIECYKKEEKVRKL